GSPRPACIPSRRGSAASDSKTARPRQSSCNFSGVRESHRRRGALKRSGRQGAAPSWHGRLFFLYLVYFLYFLYLLKHHFHRAASSPLPARFRITCAMADKHLSFSSAVPTEMRIASGKPIHPSGRTITPTCSKSSLSAFASGPTVINTKLASLGTGRNPSFANPSLNRRLSAAFVSMHRVTCSVSSSAASAAACATPDVLNGVRNLFIAASSSARPMA